MESTGTTEHSKTLIGYILTNYLEKVIQSGVIEIRLSIYLCIYNLIYYLLEIRFIN